MMRRRENRHAKRETRNERRKTRDEKTRHEMMRGKDDEMTTFHELLVLYRDQCNFVVMSLPLLQSLLHE